MVFLVDDDAPEAALGPATKAQNKGFAVDEVLMYTGPVDMTLGARGTAPAGCITQDRRPITRVRPNHNLHRARRRLCGQILKRADSLANLKHDQHGNEFIRARVSARARFIRTANFAWVNRAVTNLAVTNPSLANTRTHSTPAGH